ncbi:MAG: hypothetical protein ACAI25_09490 [Planctomycetota bacterium]
MAARIIGIFILGGAIGGGVYFYTLPDCKKGGHDDAAAVVTSGTAVVTSRT